MDVPELCMKKKFYYYFRQDLGEDMLQQNWCHVSYYPKPTKYICSLDAVHRYTKN